MASDDPIPPIRSVPSMPPERVVGPRWNLFQGIARYWRYRRILQERRSRRNREDGSRPPRSDDPSRFDREA